MAEGLFMYLQPEHVETAIYNLVDYFKQGELIMDIVSNLYVSFTTHVEVLQASGARWYWGTDDIQTVEQFHSGLKLIDRVYPKDLVGSKRFGQDMLPLFGEGTMGTLKMALASLSTSNDAFGQNGRFEFNVNSENKDAEEAT